MPHAPEPSLTPRIVVLLLLLAVVLPGGALADIGDDASNYRVSLVTIGPGELYWSRFGHNAIWIEDRRTGASLTYNYGIFDLTEAGFLLRFAQGRMSYLLAAFRAEADLSGFVAEGRRVTVQRLAMTDGQAADLFRFLEWNRQPANRSYRYDYYLDNCSTRVRDALDRALGGALERRFADVPAGGTTFRDETNRLASPTPWLYLAADLATGPAVDRPISRWDEFFLPGVLAEGVAALEVPDAGGNLRPLVYEAFELPVAEPVAEPEERPRAWPWFLGMGILLCAAMLGRGFAARAVRRLWWLTSGLIGTGLAGLWLLTDHAVAAGNANILLFPPFALLLALLAERRPVARLLRGVIVAVVAAGLLVASTELFGQRNLDWALLTLPAMLGAVAGAARTVSAGGAMSSASVAGSRARGAS